MRIIAILAATAVVFGGTAFADPGKSKGKGNNDQAQSMAGNLQGNRGDASIASQVSGNDPSLEIGGGSSSGWGNIGSSLDDGNSVSGKISSTR